jgi:tetrahydromethanopterin S-methyltransferase subunit G
MSGCPETHEKLGYFAADIATLKKGHDSILEKMDKTEGKRDKQFEGIEVKLDNQNKETAKHNKEQVEKFDKVKYGIVVSVFTAAVSPFAASSPLGQKVVSSLVVYIEKLFA